MRSNAMTRRYKLAEVDQMRSTLIRALTYSRCYDDKLISLAEEHLRTYIAASVEPYEIDDLLRDEEAKSEAQYLRARHDRGREWAMDEWMMKNRRGYSVPPSYYRDAEEAGQSTEDVS